MDDGELIVRVVTVPARHPPDDVEDLAEPYERLAGGEQRYRVAVAGPDVTIERGGDVVDALDRDRPEIVLDDETA